MKTSLLRILALVIVATPVRLLFAQGTAFTYQGSLTDSGGAANGTYDLRFTLHDAGTNGSQIGSALTNAAVAVNAGVFTVALDFGVSAFPGGSRWLEIGVRTNAPVPSPFTTLIPRQPLSATPYAIVAGNLSGTLLSNSLVGNYPNALTLNNPANEFIGAFAGNGAGLSNLNALTLAGLSSSSFWQLAGNSGTTPGTHFLGTTDNQPLELKVNGMRALRLEPNTDGAPNVIGGAPVNYVAPGAFGATIAGGGSLFYTGIGSVSNSIAGSYSAIGGGIRNNIGGSGWYATIGGGIGNTLERVGATISGGWMNSVYGGYSTIAGGSDNGVETNAGYATISGGTVNWIQTGAEFSTIAGGIFNLIQTNASASSIGGGNANMILPGAQYSMIGGGQWNSNSSPNSVISGGYRNTIERSAGLSFIGGGWANTIQETSDQSVIVGGNHDSIESGARESFVGGGFANTIQTGAVGSFIGGGSRNTNGGYVSLIGGGERNVIQGNTDPLAGNWAVINGGLRNLIASNNAWSVISGGADNTIDRGGQSSFLAGGARNVIGSNVVSSAISGGADNSIESQADLANIAGGQLNTIEGNADAAAIGGGISNVIQANAPYGAIVGGRANAATNYALAAGNRAKALHTGSLVWGDSQNVDIGSTNANSVTMRAAGGYRLFSSIAPVAGVFLAPGGGSWISMSDRNAKENVEPVDTEALLDKVARLPLSTWNYKSQDQSVRHIGPMAQDFKNAFGVGETETGITGVDADGVALAAIQGLNQKVQRAEDKLNQELQAREARIVALEKELSTLKELVTELLKSRK